MIDEFSSPEEQPDVEQTAADEPDLAPVDHEQPESPRTGNETVDGVLASLDGLSDTPVDDHVAVFERAHEQLRSALEGPRDA